MHFKDLTSFNDEVFDPNALFSTIYVKKQGEDKIAIFDQIHSKQTEFLSN